MSSTKIFKTITNFSSNKNKTISILNKAKTMQTFLALSKTKINKILCKIGKMYLVIWTKMMIQNYTRRNKIMKIMKKI